MSSSALLPVSALTAKGIARAALQSSALEQKRRVEYRELASKRWINRCQPSRVAFDWTINPYRGCEFACQYCYARYTHEFMERYQADAFETEIFVKKWDERTFLKELARIPNEHLIGIGTATDPYQPAERRFSLTRQMLELFSRFSGRRLNLITKSDLIERDCDLLAEVSRRNEIRVAVTITTLDTELARKLEPLAPRPDLRLQSVAALAKAGVAVGVINSPLMPGINGRPELIRQVAQAAKDAGAQFFCGGAIFLKPSAKKVFMPFLSREFPRLSAWYEGNFEQRAFLPDKVAARWENVVRQARAELDLDPEWWRQHRQQPESTQMNLVF